MPGYTKLFSDIVESSIWKEDSDTCKVWITLLALSDSDGYVRGSAGWLSDKARVSVGKCQEAIDKFCQPDQTSRTTTDDGRRIELLDDGWLILNYLAFRERLSDDVTAKSSRERVRKHRERYKLLRNAGTVTGQIPVYASEFVGELPGSLDTKEFRKAFAEWQEHKRQIKEPSTPLAITKQIRLCDKLGPERAIAAIELSVANGWRGIWEARTTGNGSSHTATEEVHPDDPRTAEYYDGEKR